MALTPGLRPFSEDAPEGRRRNKAAIGLKEQNTRLPSVRPQASPVDPYARPAAAPKDDSLVQLADALGTLNPALLRYGSASIAEQKEETQTGVEAKLLQAGSLENVQKLMDTDPEVKTEVGQAAAMRFLGKRLAAKAVQDANSRYANDFDRASGDIDQFTAESVKPFLDQYGSNPHFRKAFIEDATPGLERLRAGHAQFKAQETYVQNQQATSDVFLGTVRKGEAAGQTAEEQAAAVFSEFYGNRKLLGVPYQDQMKALSQVVQTLANEGRYDVVKAIGEMDRKSADGGHVGKLLDNNLVGADIAKAIIHAKTIRDRTNHDASIEQRQILFDVFHAGAATPEDEKALQALVRRNDGTVSESQAQSWIAHNRAKRAAVQEQATEDAEKAALEAKLGAQEAAITNTGIEAMKTGRLFSLPQVVTLNKKGEEEVLPPEKVRERAIADFERWSNQYAQQTGETWEQKTLRELPVFAQNGHVPKGWKDLFAAGGNAISAATIHGTELPEPAQKAYAMYRLLRANDSQMLRDLVPKDQRDLFEAWRVGEEELHIDPRKAIIAATQQSSDPTDRFNHAASITVKEIKRLMAKKFDGDLSGASDLSDKIGRRAEWYAKMGLSADTALERAVSFVKDSHVNVNGWWIDASDKRLPKSFPKLAEEMLQQYAAKHGKAEGLDASDLTIREAGTGHGAWRIVRKLDGVPVDNLDDAIFTAADLMAADARRKEEEDRKTLEEIQRNQKQRSEAAERAKAAGFYRAPDGTLKPSTPGARRLQRIESGGVPPLLP
jgi:hypothetical protein